MAKEANGAELTRLSDARDKGVWRKWGPYLSERQWGTVREDYSGNGDAWSYFGHDQARSDRVTRRRIGAVSTVTTGPGSMGVAARA